MIFWKISMKMVKFRSWKTLKSHGKSWNFKSPKEYEPCKNVWLSSSLSKSHGIFSLSLPVALQAFIGGTTVFSK